MQHEMAFECRANPLCASSATTSTTCILVLSAAVLCLPQGVKAMHRSSAPRVESSHHHHSYDWPAACPSLLISHRALDNASSTAARIAVSWTRKRACTPPRQPSIVIIF